MSDRTDVPAGWYDDPDGTGRLRWWDGSSWTEQRAARPAWNGYRTVPTAAKTGTVWIWALVLAVPAVSLLLQFATLPTFGDALADVRDPLAIYRSPGYLLSLGVSFVLYGVSAALAWRDRTELVRREVDNPFPWPWVFLSGLVYVIGRTVVLRRRGATDAMRPLSAYIVATVVITVVVLVLTITVVAANLPFPPYSR